MNALDAMPVCPVCGTLKPYHAADCVKRPFDRNSLLRRETIEECAKVADSFANAMKPHVIAVEIAAAIRALKDC